MSLHRNELQKVLHLLDITEETEIDCSEFLDLCAGYLERLGPEGTPPAGYESVVAHLRLCPECFEEFEALRRATRSGEGE